MFKSRLDFDKELVKILQKEKIGLIALAGYMRILSPYLIGKFRQRILNIHPALLPSFRGTNAIEKAFSYGCKRTGVTVHFVDQGVDTGPIILQEAVAVKADDTLNELEEKIHRVEHKLYPRALKLVIEQGVKLEGRRVCPK